MHNQVQPYTKECQPEKIFIFMALKGSFHMWPHEELSKASVNDRFFSTQRKGDLERRKKPPTFIFSEEGVGWKKKKDKAIFNIRAKAF